MKFQAFIFVWLQLSSVLGQMLPPTESTVLILYRRKDYFGSDFTIKINNRLITEKFSNNEYFQIEVPSGKVKIDTEGGFITDKQSMIFVVKANEVVFLKGIVDYDYLSNALYFKRADKEQAIKEMDMLRLDEAALKSIE